VTQVKVPDIGDFEDVPVVEILVAEGDEVAAEDPLIVLESDKASMEVPAPEAGTITKLLVQQGDTVSEGTPIAEIDSGGGDDDEQEEEESGEPEVEEKAGAEDAEGEGAGEQAGGDGDGQAPEPSGDDDFEHGDKHAQVLVLGSGPGGYTAAFRAADLGLEVILVERYESLGGVCLNVGCIPSKALLHVAKVMADAEVMSGHGVSFGEPELDLDAIRSWKEEVVEKLTKGVAQMAKARKVELVQGTGRFTGPHTLDVDGTSISFDHAIVAAGSRAAKLPDLPYDDDRLMDSTDALGIDEVPGTLLVIGGGIIGLEMATVYDALGAEVTVVELADQLIPGCDPDLVKPLRKRIEGRYAAVHVKTSVEKLEPTDDGLKATFAEGGPEAQTFDRVLVAVGRTPNGADLGLDEAGVKVDERGFVPVDERQRTNVPHIYAIGDVVPGPALAHKATYEAKVAAEVIAGEDVVFDARGIPAVAYTDPEVAWVGLTELKAKEDGTEYEAASFPWSASGRALGIGDPTGVTKVLVDPESRRILGYGIVGANAGELIAEAGLALETGADADDVGLTIHAHPTLTETVRFAAEVAAGTITDLPQKRKR
jgi:dihydrolipoyl dehydrogenase